MRARPAGRSLTAMDLALAVVLISTLDRVILGIGCVVLVGALVWAATFPISFSV